MLKFLLGIGVLTVIACGADTPDPIYSPTAEDLEIAVQIEYSRLYPTGASSLARSALNAAAEYSGAVYIASHCVGGSEMSSEGFRSFVGEALRARSLPTTAKDVISTIVRKGDDRTDRGLPAAERTCEQAYFHPDTGAEARVASDLVQAAVTLSIGSPAREAFSRSLDRRPAGWFVLTEEDRPFLLRWLCDTCAPLADKP